MSKYQKDIFKTEEEQEKESSTGTTAEQTCWYYPTSRSNFLFEEDDHGDKQLHTSTASYYNDGASRNIIPFTTPDSNRQAPALASVVIPPCPDEQQEQLPTAKFLTSCCFLTGNPRPSPFFCDEDSSSADNSIPRHSSSSPPPHAGGDIRTSSEINDEYCQPLSFDAGRNKKTRKRRSGGRAVLTCSSTTSTILPPSMEEAIRRFSASPQEHIQESNSYPPPNTNTGASSRRADDHAPPSPSAGFIDMERSYSGFPVFPKCWWWRNNPHPSSSIAATSTGVSVSGGAAVFDRPPPTSNLPMIHSDAQSACFFANNASSSSMMRTPCSDDHTILGKQTPPQQQIHHQHHPQHQQTAIFSRTNADNTSSSPSSSTAAVFDLPKLNLSTIHSATQSACFFANNASSSSIMNPFNDRTILGKETPPQQQIHQHHPQHQQTAVFSRNADNTSSSTNGNTNDEALLLDDMACIIAPSNINRQFVTGFTYAVMCQFVKATFTQADRKGNRTKTPLGRAGLKCKYCEGKGGLRYKGRYFPSSLKTFADPMKTILPMNRHLILCSKCPEDIKSLISRLHDRHEVESRKVKCRGLHGGRTSFYRRIWTSLHADASSSKQKQHQYQRQSSRAGEKRESDASSDETALSSAAA
jgi:hypothetical protein